jgi:LuxR family maltose regulon positive regulatory protein
VVQLLSTKLFIPSARPERVSRPHLIERLNEGLRRASGVTLISAPAGFGKTTLVSEWAIGSERPVAWLSLDEGDNDPARFLAYFVTALQTIAANIGEGILTVLQAPQPPPAESTLTTLLNEITTLLDNFILVLDDYHVVDSKVVDQALTFLLEHQPPQMHIVIATREDPDLPFARLRAQGQLTELRAADLRFTLSEAAEFLNQVMGLKLSSENIASLEARTEGWIAGLQLAALAMLAMQGYQDTAGFIQSFTGSHHFVMDYLVEEVLQQQSESVQRFLLNTSILDRLCGPLCEAVLLDPSTSGQETLEYLERTNLFIIHLDNERRWYRYHHLFADLLRQRLQQDLASYKEEAESHRNALHIRASQWYEDNGFELEAFHHAAAANDIERAERLIEGKGIPLHLRGAVTSILDWLEGLPGSVLDARPSLWWRYASLLLINGQTTGVEEKLQAAEQGVAAVMQGTEPDDKNRNLLGQIAAARATLALTRYDVETMFAQSRRALELLHPDNLTTRANANWTLGVAYMFQRNRAAAEQAYTESIALSQRTGATFTTILATLGLGNVQEANNELYQAAETYRRILQLTGDQPLQIIGEVHLGLAHILYEWNDLDGAEQHGQQALQLEQRYDKVIDRYIICEVFLATLKLARGDVMGAAAILSQASQSTRQHNFVQRLPEIAAAQVLVLLHQGDRAAAAHLAQTHDLPLSQARVYLAQGDTSAALTNLEALRLEAESKRWEDERLRVMVLQAVAHHARGEKEKALSLLTEALTLAEPGGFIRLFIDEGAPMQLLILDFKRLIEKQLHVPDHSMIDYANKILSAFVSSPPMQQSKFKDRKSEMVEPLSQRELEVLKLIAQGLSNDEIGKRLFLALDTVKGHNRRIYDKLQVQRRTEAIARARELGLL